jgi:hypothetical protein
MERVEVAGITIDTLVNGTGSVAIIQFVIRNENDQPEKVSLSLGSDIFVDKNRRYQLSKRPDGTGFQIVNGLSHFQVFTRNYSMVVDANSYWFGPSLSFDRSQWTQVEVSEVEDDDLSFAVSWRDREVPSHGRIIISILMSWGDDLTPPSGSLDSPPEEDDMIEWDTPMTLSGVVTGAVSVYLIIDGTAVEVTQPTGERFSLTFTPSALMLAAGTHTFVICAIDSSGAVSTISSFTTQVKAPTAAATRSLPCTRSPTASASVSVTWGEAEAPEWIDLSENEGASDANVPGILIGVGIPVGLILTLAFAFLLWRYRHAMKAEMVQRLRTGSSSQVESSGQGF